MLLLSTTYKIFKLKAVTTLSVTLHLKRMTCQPAMHTPALPPTVDMLVSQQALIQTKILVQEMMVDNKASSFPREHIYTCLRFRLNTCNYLNT